MRERGLLPILLPIAILAGIASAVLLFSRILLAVPKEVAVAVALMVAFNILAFFSYLSARPRAGGGHLFLATGVAALPLVLGTGAAVGLLAVAEEKEGPHEGGPAVVEIAAKNIAFDKQTLELAAGGEAVIKFNNQDSQPHNVAIFEGSDAQGKPVFKGEIFTGPATREYTFEAPPPGTYFFNCSVHPQMTGNLVVEEGAAGAGGAGKAVAIAAKNIAFDKQKIELAAGGDAVIKFKNDDSQPHNVAIYEGSDATGKPVFKGEIFTGPATKEYTFKAPPPGTYFFQCDVHPQMKGTVTVKEGAAQEGEAGPVAIAAKNIAFDKQKIELAAGGDAVIKFKNDDSQPHNVAIYEGSDAKGKPVFKGEIFTGPATKEYTFKAPPPGTYFFQCDVHPQQMKGTVTVKEGAAQEGEAGPVAIAAKNIAFDKQKIELAAGGDAVIKFKNDDSQPHNVAIYEGSDAKGKPVFKGEIFTGPATKEYTFKAPPPGTYFFQCDVHPQQMKGTATVR